MPETLTVDVNRERLHAVDATPSFEATDSFAVELENHGAAVHVHLHLDDALSETTALAASNHYVEAGSVRRVNVAVRDGSRPVEGKLKVVTGYGSETKYVDVSVVEPGERTDDVSVDRALGQPPARDEADESGTAASTFEADAPVVALAALALVIAASAATVSRNAAVLLGVLVVFTGLGTAAYLLR